MLRGVKSITQHNKWAIRWAFFGLFFCIVLICSLVVINGPVRADTSVPISAPPENNSPDYVLIDGSTQTKQGSLRLGTSDATSPFNYQLEVLGEGAESTDAVIDQNLKVSKTADTLFVDAANNKVCVGPCLGVTGSTLEVSGGTWSISSTNADGVQANSSSAEALYGVNAFVGVGTGSTAPGIQGTSSGASGVGVSARGLGTTGAKALAGTDILSFNSVLLRYNSGWYDQTAAAGNSLLNDIYAGNSGNGMIYDVGGAIYFGLSTPFKRISINFDARTGSAGNVTWEYCSTANCLFSTAANWSLINGTGTPASGAFAFLASNQNPTTVVLWNSLPSNFATTTMTALTSGAVSGATPLYYVRARVTSQYGNPRPIGHQFVPMPLSGAYGNSQSGYGIYASNSINGNDYGLWAGYFSGRVGSSRDVSGAKFVATQLQSSVVPYTAGQVAGTYPLGAVQVKRFDGTYLWAFSGDKLLKIRANDGFKIWDTTIGTNPTDAVFDGNAVWVTISGTDQVKKISTVDGSTLCTLSLAAGSHPSSLLFAGQYYWVVLSGTGDVVKINSSCATVGSAVHLTAATDALTKIIYTGTRLYVMSPSESKLYVINPSSGKSAYSVGVVSGDSQDILYDNAFFWVTNSTNQTVRKINTPGSKVCSVPSGTSCQTDADCDATGGCFSQLSIFGEYGIGDGGTYMAFDGTYLWVANVNGQSVSRVNTALPSDRTDYALGYVPTGIVFDGTNMFVSGPSGITKLYSGQGYGSTDMSRVLTLQSNSTLISQKGSFNISGSGRVGGTLSAAGNISATSNVWPAIGSGDVITNPDDSTWTQTGALTGATTVSALLQTAAGTLLAGANGGNVFRSLNNGTSWTGIYIGTASPTTSLARVGTRLTLGVNVGFVPTLYTSIDDGATWASLTTFGNAYYVDTLYAAQNGYVFATTHGQLHSLHADMYRSIDGGATWDPTPVANISTTYYISSLIELSDGTLFAGLTSGEIYRSFDSGTNWALYVTLSPAESIESMYRASNGYLYAGTATGSVFRSVDNGATWVKTALPSTTEVRSFVQSGSNVYAIAAGGKIFRSTDNGGSWQLLTTVTGAPQLTTLMLSSLGYLYTGTGTGLVYQSGLGVLGAGIKSCPAGHFITNITTNTSGGVVRIDCRGL